MQPESKLRAITSESGSWTKFLYRGNFSLTSVQSREGALEKVVADLLNKDYLDTAVNVMNRCAARASSSSHQHVHLRIRYGTCMRGAHGTTHGLAQQGRTTVPCCLAKRKGGQARPALRDSPHDKRFPCSLP